MVDAAINNNHKSTIKEMVDDLGGTTNDLTNKEFLLVEYLWGRRGHMTINRMAEETGWCRQTIYNKWAKYGFKIRES
jgi:hypothetical protein